MKPSRITALLGLVAACLIYQLGKADGPPRIEHMPVTITRSLPRSRAYGGAGKKAEMS